MSKINYRHTVNRIKIILKHIPLLFFSLIFIFPFYWLVSTSLKPDAEMFLMPPKLIPGSFNFAIYLQAVNALPFFRFMLNSLFLALFSIIGHLFSCTLAAYAFARLRWRGKNIIFATVLATMMLPHHVMLIPLYLIFKEVNMIDTYFPLLLPTYFGNAFFIFLLRQFFITLPAELEESARIDGAGFFATFLLIMVPQIGAALITVALFGFIFSWNDFVNPLIFINTTLKMPISIGLQMFKSYHSTEYGMLMAAASLTAIPPILLFLVLQKRFIEGITMTGIKG